MLDKNNETRTEISELGEFKLIEHLTKSFQIFQPSTKKSVGDDAAVIDTKGKQIVVSSDLLIEKIHFDLAYTPCKHLGYKTAMVNFSDIAAMNAIPTQLLVNIALSNRFSVEAVEEIYEGIKIACEKHKVDLVGGDTSASPSGLFISATVLGLVESEKICFRNKAQNNDLICVSGDLGAAYAGLLILQRENEVFKSNPQVQPDLTGYEYIIGRQLKPEARIDIVNQLAEMGVIPTAMIDISDGLSSEILHICKQSNVGCNIYIEKIPIDAQTAKFAEDCNIEPATFALNGGEDYELLFTIKQSDYSKIVTNSKIHIIGHITPFEQGCNLINTIGTQIPITAQGWNAIK